MVNPKQIAERVLELEKTMNEKVDNMKTYNVRKWFSIDNAPALAREVIRLRRVLEGIRQTGNSMPLNIQVAWHSCVDAATQALKEPDKKIFR